MDEILKLQQELAAVQQSTSKQRLSDRNCIELVQKLQSLNLITLIFTRSGKEYLTPNHLIQQTRDTLVSHEGRLNLTDLADILNVSLSNIETTTLPAILSSSSSTESNGNNVRLIRGEFITDYYLQSLIEDVNDYLRQSIEGTDSLADVSTRVSLPVEIVREALIQYGHKLKAEFDVTTGIITSEKAVRRKRARARGKLTATASSVLSVKDKIEETVALDMLENGSLIGRLESSGGVGVSGGGKVFVPGVLEKAGAQSVVSRFRSEGFVSVDEVIRRLYVGKASVDVLARDRLGSDSVVMKKAVVSGDLVERVSTGAEEAFRGGSWLDVVASVPPSFPAEDLTEFVALVAIRVTDTIAKEDGGDKNVNHVEAKGVAEVEMDVEEEEDLETNLGMKKKKGAKTKKTGKGKGKRKDRKQKVVDGTSAEGKKGSSDVVPVIADRFIVSLSLLQTFRDTVTADAQNRADLRAKTLAERMETVGSQTDTIQTGNITNNSSAPDGNGSGKRAKGKGRRRAGGKDKEKDKDQHQQQNSSSFSNTDNIGVPTLDEIVSDIILSNPTCISLVTSDFFGEEVDVDDLEGSAGEDLVKAFIEQELPEEIVRELYIRKALEAVETLEKERREAMQRTERDLLSLLHKAEVLDKAAGSLPTEELMLKSRQWVLKSVCVKAVCKAAEAVGRSNGVIITMEDVSIEERMEYLRKVREKLAPVVENRVRELVDTVRDDDGEISELLRIYDEVVGVLDLPERRPMDKKSERAALVGMKMEVTEQLIRFVDGEGEEIKGREILRMGCVLVHAKRYGGSIVDFCGADVDEFARAIAKEDDGGSIGDALMQLTGAVEAYGFDIAFGGEHDGREETGEGKRKVIKKVEILAAVLGVK